MVWLKINIFLFFLDKTKQYLKDVGYSSTKYTLRMPIESAQRRNTKNNTPPAKGTGTTLRRIAARPDAYNL